MSLKELKKWIIWILVIILLFLLILLFRIFIIDKNLKVGKDRKLSDSSQSSSTSDNKDSKLNQFVDDFKEGYNEGKEKDHEYSDYNFDDRLLMYEGDHKGESINAVLDLLKADADDNFYSNPGVKLVNFENADKEEFVCDNIETYKSDIEAVKSQINSDSTYNVSFGYGTLNAIAKEVIITKK